MNEYKKDILKRSKMWLVAAIVLLLCWMICEFIKEESILSLFLMFMSLFCSIVFAVHMILIIVPVMSAFIGKLIGKLIRKKSQLTIEDLKKDKDYYREILLNNSPLILGYLDNLELEKKDIIAEILFLKIENIIEISDGKIEKAENYHTAKLKPTQKQILEKILYGKLRIKESFLLELREAISHEAENLFLIKKKEKISKKNDIIAETFAKFGAICAFLLLVLAILSVFIPNLLKMWANIVISLIIMSLVLIFAAIPFIMKYKENLGSIYKRTQKGQEVKKQLEGLKNYLKDYSMLDERESKELELWDEYLVYSVMFGHNQKIIEEYEKYLEIEK